MTLHHPMPPKVSSRKARTAAAVFGTMLTTVLLFGAGTLGFAAEDAVIVPPPTMTEATSGDTEKAIFAGGCFWGVQGVFQHVKGVKNAVSGYAGGAPETAQYEAVGSGETGHAESVEISFDPKVVSYGTLLQVYFSVAHNPTQLNFQGPDTGTQYRSTIFAENDAQKKVAEAYIAQLNAAKVFDAPIVTTIELKQTFYPAEAYHQDYATLHPESGYIARFDLPKIANLSKVFPELYTADPNLVSEATTN